MSRTPPFDPLQAHIAVIGLGYVGLPLAVAFGERRDTLGFDIDAQRVAQLQQGHDATLELDDAELAAAGQLRYTADAAELAGCTIFIVTVPTPIDSFEQPDLEPLRSATVLIAAALKPGDLVIYESTVYPGTTEEVCVPLLEEASGLRFNADFFCGYSPERVNPVTGSGGCATFARSPPAPHLTPPTRWMRSTPASSRPAPGAPNRSAWPKRPRWWRTSSATSTLRWSTSWR